MAQATISRDDYDKLVRSALRQLYDAQALERHPLAALMASEGAPQAQAAQHLRRLLLDAIAAIRPAPNVPISSPDRRAYRIIELRYLEGLTATEAMETLALQKSQYFRDQGRALDRVSLNLWSTYERLRAEHLSSSVPPDASSVETGSVDAAVERLSRGAVLESLDGSSVLQNLSTLWGRLEQSQGVTIRVGELQPLPLTQASRVLLRQAILNVVTSAMEQVPGSAIEIETVRGDAAMGILVRTQCAIAPEGTDRAPIQVSVLGQRLETSRQLMLQMRGSLQMHVVPGRPWQARLLWPSKALNRVLVIDDNQGFCELFTRYLDGHDWRVLGASNLDQAQRLIAAHEPTVITLDVLMPQQDGWDVLMALQTDPATQHIPVIVCSVLQEPELAFALGASAYLPKPVSERSLLSALRPWSAERADSPQASPRST